MNINGAEVKRELIDKRVKGDERIAVLSGFLRVTFSLERHGGQKSMSLGYECGAEEVRSYINECIMDEFKIMPKSDSDMPVFTDADKLLSGVGIMNGDGEMILDAVPSRFVSDAQNYIRGVFLGCGSLSVPNADDAQSGRSGGYHLEFSFTNEGYADAIVALLAENGVAANRTKERTRSSDKYVVYVKDSENVSNCLALIGAEKTVLKLYQAVAALSVKGNVNRRINCDLANMTRTADAAVEVAEAIELIDKRVGLETLVPKLLEAAEARINSPDVPLSQLAYELGISKSGLKHRYDKIIEIAEKLKSDNKED